MAEKDNLQKLKENYEKLRKKYNLPEFDKLDDEFEIRKIDYDLNLVREIKRLVSSRLLYISDLLDPILNPHESLRSSIESNAVSEDDINEMVRFYKEIWHLLHVGANASFISDDEEAKYINDIVARWPKIKAKVKYFSDKLIIAWSQAEKDDAPSHYTG
ncbi:MAG: hypothetical protein J4451_00340 [DPANN group archaeon]|nr:hypothetical protein [DPANN group archaeon]